MLDGEVLQPPLLLLSGLGEVSRIGEVILNPYLGPRLKSGVVTTDAGGPGGRAELCGRRSCLYLRADRYMAAVIEAAERQGCPEEARHLEYFSVPEQPDYVNHDFTLRLVRSNREVLIPADRSATDVLAEQGVHVDVKCSDGLCGVCRCGLVGGAVEHQDFVLSKAQRETSLILCQSRAAEPGGVVEVDL